MQRYDIINFLIKKYHFKSYLEIGVLGRETLNQINLPVKHGVDPNADCDYVMTSDEFFANHCKQKYDLIFIDGLHLKKQVLKDIENSLANLNENGIIIIHDCLPTEEWHQLEQGIPGKPWVGTTWKAFADLRCSRWDLKMYVVDTDWGCGIIQKGDSMWDNRLLKPQEAWANEQDWTWEFFKQNRNELMNVITVEEFIGRI